VSSFPERLATLEAQNAECSQERQDAADAIMQLQAAYHQVKGGIRVLVGLWTIATVLLGIFAAKHW